MSNSFKLNKKILIVSSWAPPAIGGPQSLYNLFSNIDKNSYAILTNSVNISEKAKQTGSYLSCLYFFYDKQKTPLWFVPNSKAPILIKIAKKITLGVFTLYRIMQMIRIGLRVIHDQKIDRLMGISDVGPSLILTFILSKFSRKPYTLYLYDLYKGNNLPRPWKLISNFFEPILFRGAKTVVVTNEGTRQYYQSIYSDLIKFDVIHNSVFAENYENVQMSYNPKSPYTIVFTGHIYWPQERSVRNLITAVSEINDIDVKLLLYVPSPPQDLVETYKNHPKIKFDVAPQSEMPRIQSGADILFLPFAWRTPSPQIIATASPGKLTDYLASGRPILIHAPPYAYVSQYAKEYGFAHIVDKESIPLLQDGIRKLLQDHDYSRKLIKNARELFLKNHDAVKNAELLKKIINEL